MNGTRSLQLSIVDAGDAPLWTSAARDVTFISGSFSMVLGESPDPAIPDAVFSTEEIYVTVSVEGTPLVGRQRLLSQPYAIRATSAYEASAGGPLQAAMDATNANVAALEQSVGAGVVAHNVNGDSVVPAGTARLVLATGNGDYRYVGVDTCTNGRLLSIGYTGSSGIVTVRNNGCGGFSPCAPFRNNGGADIGIYSAQPAPVNYMCVGGSWWQM